MDLVVIIVATSAFTGVLLAEMFNATLHLVVTETARALRVTFGIKTKRDYDNDAWNDGYEAGVRDGRTQNVPECEACLERGGACPVHEAAYEADDRD